MSDDTTQIIKNMDDAFETSKKEAEKKPAALLILGGELNGTIFDLVGDKITIGRSPQNTIALEFNGISRFHTTIHCETETSHIIEDKASKNGTIVNNQVLSGPTLLQKGDIIKIGNVALKYIPQGDPERLTYDKLNLDANTDRHTKCFNKAYFNEKIEVEVKKSKVTGSPLSLIVFDLDHFKNLNDTYGHDAGDHVLIEIANLIRKNGVRDIDVFARYGGEEFVILLPGTNLKKAYEIAERLRKLTEAHNFIYDEQRILITVSIGVADYRHGVYDGTTLFKRADQAVYKAKRGGRNQVQFFKE